MLLQLQVWAFWLLQEAAAESASILARCGTRWACWRKLVVIGSVHHVRMVDRRHDRPFDRL